MKNIQNNVNKIVIAIVILILSGAGIYAYNARSQVANTTDKKITAQSEKIEFEGITDKTVFELLESKYNVVSEKSSFGVMVKSINGIEATSKKFWTYTVNGKFAEVGADQYKTQSGDKIVWEYKGM